MRVCTNNIARAQLNERIFSWLIARERRFETDSRCCCKPTPQPTPNDTPADEPTNIVAHSAADANPNAPPMSCWRSEPEPEPPKSPAQALLDEAQNGASASYPGVLPELHNEVADLKWDRAAMRRGSEWDEDRFDDLKWENLDDDDEDEEMDDEEHCQYRREQAAASGRPYVDAHRNVGLMTPAALPPLTLETSTLYRLGLLFDPLGHDRTKVHFDTAEPIDDGFGNYPSIPWFKLVGKFQTGVRPQHRDHFVSAQYFKLGGNYGPPSRAQANSLFEFAHKLNMGFEGEETFAQFSVEKDSLVALYFKRAADQGHLGAQNQYASMLEMGIGTNTSGLGLGPGPKVVDALRYSQLAAENNGSVDDSPKEVQKLQRAEAEGRVERCQAALPPTVLNAKRKKTFFHPVTLSSPWFHALTSPLPALLPS